MHREVGHNIVDQNGKRKVFYNIDVVRVESKNTFESYSSLRVLQSSPVSQT